MQLLFGFLIALLLFWLVRYRLQSSPRQAKQWWLSLALGITALVFILLALTGRLQFLVAAGAALILLIRRVITLVQYGPLLKQALDFFKGNLTDDDEQTSSVTTSLLTMTLDHRTGLMDGEVLAGEYAGQHLSRLHETQLAKLYRECRGHYPDSVAVLEAYLDRRLDSEWRAEAAREGQAPRSPDDLTREQALAILGLEEGASREEIIQAHRRMMQKVHPDRGGSDFLAAQVNRAKTLLLD